MEIIDEFFDSDMEESVSPFLTKKSRKWGKNLHLKSAILAAFLLLFSFILSFYEEAKTPHAVLLLFAYFFAGIPALISSIEDLLNFELNIDVLMTLAAFSSILIGSGTEGALLLVLFSLSGAMEDAVKTRAKGTILAIKKAAPTKAFVLTEEGSILERSVRDIAPGTKILVKAGEIVPLDGIVVEGNSSVNLAHLTGEHVPIVKKIGDIVPSGARNLEGSLTLAVTLTSNDSTMAKIIKLITEAQEAKPKLQRFLDKISGRYAASIIASSFLIALMLPWFTDLAYMGKEGSIYRALAFLIAASPCALIIAIPIAYLSAVSSCARQGILLKGGVILDQLATCRILAFDKTGTITQGELTFINISPSLDEEALRLSYSLERHVIHPIAKALTEYAEKNRLYPLPITDFTSWPGLGLEGSYQGKKVYIGNREFIYPKLNVEQKKYLDEETAHQNALLTFLLYEKGCFILTFSDQIRTGVNKVLNLLQKKWKMRLLMLTGDHYKSAKMVATEVGLDEFHADLKPEQKLEIIDKLAKKENLAMVGDGINDAPSLARATVGISMGKKGSGTAIDVSDIVLLHDNIEHLEWLVARAHALKKIVRENLFFASLAIIVATTPALLGWIPLWVAVILHEGGTVAVGLNALRLLKR